MYEEQIEEQVVLFKKLYTSPYISPKERYKQAENYENGLNIEKNEIEAYKLYCQLSEEGYAPAQYRLGYLYLNNIFCALYEQVFFKKSLLPETMEHLMQLANIDDDTYAKDAIERVCRCNIYNAKKLFELAADQGNADAQCALGVMYAEGKGGDQNIDKAIEYYQSAIQQGHIEAKFRFADICIVKNNIEQAILLYKEVADLEYAPAQYDLGIRYIHGTNIEKKTKLGMELIIKAADAGYALAQYSVGVRYAFGDEVIKDEGQAVCLCLKSAEQGCVEAQNSIGLRYAHGYGVEKSYSKALFWYRKASAKLLADAQYNLGEMYNNGYGVDVDINKAISLYKKAAVQGHTEAAYAIGVAYRALAVIVNADDNDAELAQFYLNATLKWYRQAALQGNAASQYDLGVMYMFGEGVAKNNTNAAEWFEKAAARGHKAAQHNFALMCEHQVKTKSKVKAKATI